jgi:predicted permease
MDIISTIIPIFAVIFLGWFARSKDFMPPSFLEPANRLVYHLAIPAMIFHKIAKASLRTQFDGMVIAVTLVAILVVFALSWGVGLMKRLEQKQLGTFMQCSFHGNLGYIGLAVAYYYLGNEGFVSASIIAGFIMILQNFLAVVALQLHAENGDAKKNRKEIVLKIFANPVIVSALAGMLYSLTGIGMPLVVDRSLAILSGLALPMALLIIGASLSFELMQLQILRVMTTGVIKLVLLPGLGFVLYRSFGLAMQDYLPGLILLAAPSATLTYVMAKEMKGDTDFAVAAISTSTMASAITFSIWLNVAG